MPPRENNSPMLELVQAIIAGEKTQVRKLISANPELAKAKLEVGASRQHSVDFYYKEIEHYLYAGDTGLHAAAAAYNTEIARYLIECGAEVNAKNRRGAEPLHYASDGAPTNHTWNPDAQAKVIELLIASGANPNALDKSGVAPIHRAVRTRCTSAVRALLKNGADVRLKNKNGSTPLHLAVQNTGRGGSGSSESKANQVEIIKLLLNHGASSADKDLRGKSVIKSAKDESIKLLL